jgi:hypothetical protein
MRKNEEYFFSKTSPDLWLFQLAPLDRKFAPLEDALLLRALLMNCELIGTEKDFLLLKRVSREKPRSAVLEEGSLRPGESLDIRKWGDTALWIEIELEPSFAGGIRQLAYRPPTVRLAAWREPGRELLYRHQAAWPMLKAGFLASPLVKRTQDAQQLLAEKRSIRPGAYTLELGDSASWWRERANYRVYRLDQ